MLEQSGSGQVSASMAPLPQLLGAKVRKIAGAAVTDKEKPKEIREREKVEKRLTEVSDIMHGILKRKSKHLSVDICSKNSY